MTISAGTRTRNLWIRSPARSSIAPQRPHHTHSISTRTEKAHTFCITSHLGILLRAVGGQGQLENLEWRSTRRLRQSFSQHCGFWVLGDRRNGAVVIFSPRSSDGVGWS